MPGQASARAEDRLIGVSGNRQARFDPFRIPRGATEQVFRQHFQVGFHGAFAHPHVETNGKDARHGLLRRCCH